MTMVGPETRAAGLGAAATVATGAVAWWSAGGAVSRWPGTAQVGVDQAFTVLASAAAALVASWATVLLALATVDLLRARTHAVRGGLVGRVAAGLLLAVTLGAAPAAASTPAPVPAAEQVDTPAGPGGPRAAQPASDAQPVSDAATVPAPVPVPGWTPTVVDPAPPRAAVGEVGLVTTAPSSARADDAAEVVVRRGDTLWSIAARALGEHATDQDVAEEWPRWYAANRDTIGADPDLIRPGQRLVAPAEAGR